MKQSRGLIVRYEPKRAHGFLNVTKETVRIIVGMSGNYAK